MMTRYDRKIQSVGHSILNRRRISLIFTIIIIIIEQNEYNQITRKIEEKKTIHNYFYIYNYTHTNYSA